MAANNSHAISYYAPYNIHFYICKMDKLGTLVRYNIWSLEPVPNICTPNTVWIKIFYGVPNFWQFESYWVLEEHKRHWGVYRDIWIWYFRLSYFHWYLLTVFKPNVRMIDCRSIFCCKLCPIKWKASCFHYLWILSTAALTSTDIQIIYSVTCGFTKLDALTKDEFSFSLGPAGGLQATRNGFVSTTYNNLNCR